MQTTQEEYMTYDEANSIWKKLLKQIKSAFSPVVYKLHFEKSEIVAVVDGVVTVGVGNSASIEEISKKFKGMLLSMVEEHSQEISDFVFVVHTSAKKEGKGESENATSPLPFTDQNEAVYADTTLSLDEVPRNPSSSTSLVQKVGSSSSSLQSTYNGLSSNSVFENFIVGSSNNVAYAASLAVAQNPGKGYNPLFIYGGVGLGKTHLMMAVGNAVLARFPSKKILYFPSERFMNEFIQSLRDKTIDKFRDRYRNSDIILVDDIQFISGKDSTQEEFFHTFNEIVGRGGHVLMTSDRTPEEIPQLEERLSSRFKGGMMVDVGLPDYEMRVAIIQSKCKDMSEDLEPDAVEFLASRITTNTRELQGKLFQILSKLKTTGSSGSVENVRIAFGEESTQSPKLTGSINPQKVIQVIHHHFAIKKSELLGSRRTKNLVIPRQIAMYILKQELGLPHERVGELLGGRDHTTVMHGVRQIETALSTDEMIRKEVMLIKQELSA